MAARSLAGTIDAVTRVYDGVAPPVAPDVFAGGTRLTGRWVSKPLDVYVPAMTDHVLVSHLFGSCDAWVKTDGKRVRARAMPGTITLVPRGQDSERVTTASLEVSHVYLSHHRLLTCAEQIGTGRKPELIDRQNFRDARLFSIARLLLQEVESREAASRLFIEQLLDLVCIQLLREHSASTLPNAGRHHGLAPWQVRRVTTYMRHNLDQDIGLQELADIVSLSRFHFCTAFRIATGYTPHECLTRLRILEARRLLAEPSMPISDIALAVGYRTSSAFGAVFRRLVGTTPREFRRKI